jgi:hypothetical protein
MPRVARKVSSGVGIGYNIIYRTWKYLSRTTPITASLRPKKSELIYICKYYLHNP